MWYTAPMINDVTQVWKGVVDRMFMTGGGNGTGFQGCVKDSTGAPSSVSGGGQRKQGQAPPPVAPLQVAINAGVKVGLGWGAMTGIVLVYTLCL
jgi:hypothetical protein